MNDKEPYETASNYQHEPGQYEIRVQGRLSARWAALFEGMTLAECGGTTVIRGAVADQAALHAVLRSVRDLGLELVSVSQVQPTREEGNQ